MQKFFPILTVAFIAFAGGRVFAGGLPDVPNRFTAGTKAVADEVNANFDALVQELNDNATGIAVNTNDIGDNAKKIKNIDSGKVDKSGDTMTGTLTAPGFSLASAKQRWLAIPGAAFAGSPDEAYKIDDGFFIAPTTPNRDLVVVAPIHLPDGATIQSMKVGVYDEDPGADIHLLVLGGLPSVHKIMETSSSRAGGLQTLTAFPPFPQPPVSNASETLVVRVVFDPPTATPPSDLLRLYQVSIAYTVTDVLP